MLQAKHTGIALSRPPSLLVAPHLSLVSTFAASIIFEDSQIFHGHASGRFPSTWDGSIILSSFAWVKPDKHNALCSTGRAFCIILVFEYISEYLPMDWSQFLAMSFHTDIESHSRMKMNGFCEESSLSQSFLIIIFLEVYSLEYTGNVQITLTTADEENETDQYTDLFGQLAS